MRHIGLIFLVVAAILIGVATGLFLGPLTSFIKPVGDIFVMLLQMTTLPYICFSIIHGLGSITPEIAKKLLKKGGLFFVSIWAIGFVCIFIMTFLIPEPVLVTIGKSQEKDLFIQNFLSYVIPQNPIYDFVNNIVPAIAIFSLIVGMAVMHLKVKEPLLGLLERAISAIETILMWLAHMAPIGIFSLIAYAFGTVNFQDLYKLQLYVFAFIGASLFITLVILPILLRSLTSLHYQDIYRNFRKVCLLAFATGVPSIAFPFIIRNMRKLGEKNHLPAEKFHNTSQTIIPLGYSFAQIGNCFVLFFIFFLSFYFRHPFIPSEKFLISLISIPLSFGAAPFPVSAIHFFITQLGFPKQALELFTETFAVTAHFQVLISIAGVFTFIILVLFSYYDLLQVRWKTLLWKLSAAFSSFILLIILAKYTFTFKDNYQNLYMKLRLTDAIFDPVPSIIYTNPDIWKTYSAEHPNPEVTGGPVQVLASILKTGVLRVGYNPYTIPYCYINDESEVVGYDIAYAYQLARDLDCKLELIPISIGSLGDQISSEFFDIGMSALIMDESRLRKMDFSNAYTEEDNILVVPKRNKDQFLDYNKVTHMQGLKIGAPGAYADVAKRHFPLAVIVADDDLALLQEGKIDALLWSSTHAFIWCLNHPEYVIIQYSDILGKKYFAYAIKQGAYQLHFFLNDWLYLKTQQGFEEKQKKYWIDGITPESEKPRWSIIRNVLHWVD